MATIAESRITSQGQISVPAEVRRRLGVGPGSTLEWNEEDGRVVVKAAKKYTSADIRRALFPDGPPKRVSIEEMDEGIREYMRKSMRAIDTNVLLRLVTGDDPVQCGTAEDFVEKGAWVSVLVFAETVWTLASKYGHDAGGVERAVKMLLSHDRIVLQDADAVSEALELFSRRPSLGFSDCLILALARKHGYLPLGTFDRNLGKLPGAQRL